MLLHVLLFIDDAYRFSVGSPFFCCTLEIKIKIENLTVLGFLSVSDVLAEFLDEESRGGVENGDISSSVLTLKLDDDSDTLVSSASLDDIFTDLLGVLFE